MSEFQESKVYYYGNVDNNPIRGRGEPLRLLLDDAAIKFEYVKLAEDEWPPLKEKLIQDGVRVNTLPFIITKTGEHYGGTTSLLRYISKSLNKYIPKDPKDEFLADAYSDIYLDWMSTWVDLLHGGYEPEQTKQYETVYRINQQANWENILGDKNGAYIFGDEVSYTDFLLYHQLNNDNKAKVDASKYPRLAQFVKTIEARPSLKAHFENEKKEFSELQA